MPFGMSPRVGRMSEKFSVHLVWAGISENNLDNNYVMISRKVRGCYRKVLMP